MFRIVHCADLHIGAKCSGLSPNKALLRREEIKKALTYIIDFSVEKNADALLICGDLFDTPNPPAPDVYFVRSEFERLGSIPVFIAAGNHDYLNAHSPYAEGALGERVTVFSPELEAFDVSGTSLRIYGRSFSAPSIEPLTDFPEIDRSYVNILCMHGDISKIGDYTQALPEAVASFGADYCALGHAHTYRSFDIGSVKCVNPGTPEGHGFDDSGCTGFVYAELSKEKRIIRHISKTIRQYVSLSVDVTELQTNKNIIAELESRISEDNIYQIAITGSLGEESDFSRAYLESYLAPYAFSVKVLDRTTQDAPLDVITAENSPRGFFLRELKRLCRSEDEFAEAARIGLNAIAGRETDI